MNRSHALSLALALLVCGGLLLGCQPSPQESYERGVAAMGRGDWAAAARSFEAAGDLADAPERAAEALALVDDAQSQYEVARQAMRARRWFEAYVALEQVIALNPDYSGASGDLARVTAELDKLLAQAKAKLDADDPAAAATLYEKAGSYHQADASAKRAHQLAAELDDLHRRMVGAAKQADWATALELYAALSARAPQYRDLDRLHASYLRQAYGAAERALDAGRQTEALHLLTAVAGVDPGYEDTQRLLQQARMHAVDELMGVHPSSRVVGKQRGWELRLDSVEVRPEGELLVRATVTNATSMRNHLACLQNDGTRATIYPAARRRPAGVAATVGLPAVGRPRVGHQARREHGVLVALSAAGGHHRAVHADVRAVGRDRDESTPAVATSSTTTKQEAGHLARLLLSPSVAASGFRHRQDIPAGHHGRDHRLGGVDLRFGRGIELVAGHDDARHALLDGLGAHGSRLAREDVPVVHGGRQMIVVEAQLLAIGRDLGGGGQAHLVGDGARAHVQRAAEDGRESPASC